MVATRGPVTRGSRSGSEPLASGFAASKLLVEMKLSCRGEYHRAFKRYHLLHIAYAAGFP